MSSAPAYAGPYCLPGSELLADISQGMPWPQWQLTTQQERWRRLCSRAGAWQEGHVFNSGLITNNLCCCIAASPRMGIELEGIGVIYGDQREAGGLENKNYLAPLNRLRQPVVLQNKNINLFSDRLV